jgi:hypothetical protein
VHPFGDLEDKIGFAVGLQARFVGQQYLFSEIMAASVRILVGAKGNSFLERKSGKKKNFGGRRNATVMASLAFPGMKEEYKTLRLSPGAAEKDIKKAYHLLALQVWKYPVETMHPSFNIRDIFNDKSSVSRANRKRIYRLEIEIKNVRLHTFLKIF